jgi:nitrite reductase/ring-hydroxylating ferredoxin subunit/uncharacterized membrane protein
MSDSSQQSPDVSPAPFAERFSDGFQGVLQKLLGTSRPSPRRVKSFLNGTWLGHPLHPMLTDIPLASWVVTAIFDVIWLSTHAAWAAPAALVTLIIGVLTALAAAVTGLTDWSDTYGAERRIGLNHALFNTISLLLYLVSGVLRLLAGPGDTLVAAILSFLGLVSVIYAGYLGGEMVFTKGTGVNHTAWEAGSEDYETVLPVEAVKENTLHRVTVAGVPVILLRQGERFFAISATCPHAGGPLDEGTLTGDQVECPWHGSRFCIRDGRVLTGPAVVNAPRYDVRVTDGRVMLKRMGEH